MKKKEKLMNDTTMVCEDATSDGSENEACSTVIQFFKLPEAERFRIVCICQRHAEKRGYHTIPRICTDTDVTQVHLAEQPVCEDEQLTTVPECSYSLALHKHVREKDPSVFFLPARNAYVTICPKHAHLRGYYAFPRQLTDADGKQKYDLQRSFEEAKRTFVQIYHPELTCKLNGPDCKRDQVTNYLFSDGSSLPLCTVHYEDSPALMSREYYDQVYSLKLK